MLDDHSIIMGLTDYQNVLDIDGEPIGGFADYTGDLSSNYFDDSFERSLAGSAGADYILGLEGDDWLYAVRETIS